jgi:hypothetical protein
MAEPEPPKHDAPKSREIRPLDEELLVLALSATRYLLAYAILFGILWIYFTYSFGAGTHHNPTLKMVSYLSAALAALYYLFVIFPIFYASSFRGSFLSYFAASAAGLSALKLLIAAFNSGSYHVVRQNGIYYHLDGRITVWGLLFILSEVALISLILATWFWLTRGWGKWPSDGRDCTSL